MPRLSIAVLVVASSIACDDRSGGHGKGSTPVADAPMPCESDADCPPAACGPCTPGEVVTRKRVAIECKTNPCIDGGLVCSADHVCVVRDGAKVKPPRE